MKTYIRKPAKIKAMPFHPAEKENWPPEFVPWDRANDPKDGSFGYVENKNGNCHVFFMDWICKVSNWTWVVEREAFKALYMLDS